MSLKQGIVCLWQFTVYLFFTRAIYLHSCFFFCPAAHVSYLLSAESMLLWAWLCARLIIRVFFFSRLYKYICTLVSETNSEGKSQAEGQDRAGCLVKLAVWTPSHSAWDVVSYPRTCVGDRWELCQKPASAAWGCQKQASWRTSALAGAVCCSSVCVPTICPAAHPILGDTRPVRNVCWNRLLSSEDCIKNV